MLFLFVSDKDQYRWNSSFNISDDNPYGCKVTYQLLPNLFTKDIETLKEKTIAKYEEYEAYELDEISDNRWEDDELYHTEEEPYDEDEYVIDYSDETAEEVLDDPNKHNYIIVTDAFQPGIFESKSLLYHVRKGNDVLLATRDIAPLISEHLQFSLNQRFPERKDSLSLNFIGNKLKRDLPYKFRKGTTDHYLEIFNSDDMEVLARNSLGDATFARFKYGEGNFYISTTPHVFTNYNVIDERNHDYAEACLSFIDDEDLVWLSTSSYRRYNPDMQRDSFDMDRDPFEFEDKRSQFELIFENPPLTWAFWMTIGFGIIYLLFKAKRRQRPVPIIPPAKNSTIEFVKIISELYFHKGDHMNLAQKKIAYFLEYIRSGFYVRTNDFNEVLFEKVSERSGVDIEKVRQLFNNISAIRSKTRLTQAELLNITNLIEEFKKESKI